MATGSFWNTDNPAAPWGPFDPDDVLDFPIDIGARLLAMSTAYSSHEIIANTPLECVDEGAHVDGVIRVRMQLLAGAAFANGRKYPFTVRVIGADGQQTDRTLWLKVAPR